MRGKIREFRYKIFLKSVNPESFISLLKHLEFSNNHGLVLAIDSEDPQLIIQHYEEMPGIEREKLEQTLTCINDFNSDDGMVHLVCVADEIGFDRQDLTPMELAIQLFIHEKFSFERAYRMLSLNSARGYEEFMAKRPIPCDSVSDDCLGQIEALFSEHLKAKEYGKKVYVEQQEYPDRLVLTAWTESYTKTIATLSEKSEVKYVNYRPVYDSTIIYYPDEGRLKVKAQNASLVELARLGFANICLKKADMFEHSEAKSILDLDRIKKMKTFLVDEKAGILSVRLTGIRGKIHSGAYDSFELRFYNSSLEEALAERNLDIEDIIIQKIWIEFKLRLSNGTLKKKTAALSAPHTMGLIDTEYDRLIEQSLKKWGIITGAQRVLELA